METPPWTSNGATIYKPGPPTALPTEQARLMTVTGALKNVTRSSGPGDTVATDEIETSVVRGDRRTIAKSRDDDAAVRHITSKMC